METWRLYPPLRSCPVREMSPVCVCTTPVGRAPCVCGTWILDEGGGCAACAARRTHRPDRHAIRARRAGLARRAAMLYGH